MLLLLPSDTPAAAASCAGAQQQAAETAARQQRASALQQAGSHPGLVLVLVGGRGMRFKHTSGKLLRVVVCWVAVASVQQRAPACISTGWGHPDLFTGFSGGNRSSGDGSSVGRGAVAVTPALAWCRNA